MKEIINELGKVRPTCEGLHDKTIKYDLLSIVNDENGKSYISKIDVPENTEITNETYWQPIAAVGKNIQLGRKYNAFQINELTINSNGEAIYLAFTPLNESNFIFPTAKDNIVDEENNTIYTILHTSKGGDESEGGYKLIYIYNDNTNTILRVIHIGGKTYNKEDIKVLSIINYDLNDISNIKEIKDWKDTISAKNVVTNIGRNIKGNNVSLLYNLYNLDSYKDIEKKVELPLATETSAGIMSLEDKSKLDINNNIIVEWNDNFRNTVSQISNYIRKTGLKISYKHPINGWIDYRYINNNIAYSYWTNINNWELITNNDLFILNNKNFNGIIEGIETNFEFDNINMFQYINRTTTSEFKSSLISFNVFISGVKHIFSYGVSEEITKVNREILTLKSQSDDNLIMIIYINWGALQEVSYDNIIDTIPINKSLIHINYNTVIKPFIDEINKKINQISNIIYDFKGIIKL